jgi:hypothetical protein
MLDHTDDNFNKSDAPKMISGMINNLPKLLPIPSRDTSRNRRNLRIMGIQKPAGMTYRDLPMATIPEQADQYIERYARKIAVALFYRDKGRIASESHKVFMQWGQLVDSSFMRRAEGFLAMPNLTIGSRVNMNIGNQLAYRHVKANDPDVFGLIVQFGTGLVICGMVVSADTAQRLTIDAKAQGIEAFSAWINVRENYPL